MPNLRSDECGSLGRAGLKDGEPSRTRTCDPLVKSQLLYQLSYRPTNVTQSKVSGFRFQVYGRRLSIATVSEPRAVATGSGRNQSRNHTTHEAHYKRGAAFK